MATGRQATTQLTAGAIGTLTNVYIVPAGYYGIYNISFTNTAATSVQIRLAFSTSSTQGGIGASEYYEYQTSVAPYGVFERTGLLALGGSASGSTPYIWVGSNGTAVNVNVYGIETSTS